jgi:hypothetical protein
MRKIPPKRVKIIQNTGHEFYNKYIGTEANVLSEMVENGFRLFTLDIPVIDQPNLNSQWSEGEVEIIEWRDVIGVEDVIKFVDSLESLINKDEYDVDVANEIIGEIKEGLKELK